MQKFFFLAVTSSLCMLIIGIFIGTAVANKLPYEKEKYQNSSAKNTLNLQALQQELTKQENLKQNCEKLLNKYMRP